MTHHSRICIVLCGITLALARAAVAQDLRIDASSVSNAASYIASSYPNGGVSHGGMFIVKAAAGSGALGACGVKIADRFPIATSMNGTSMKIAMGGSSFDVPMIYVVACSGTDQLAGIVPSSVPPGHGTLTVVYNVLPALDVQAVVATDLSNTPGDTLSFLAGARYYLGAL